MEGDVERKDGIFYRGDTRNCVDGAMKEYRAAGRGIIFQIGVHAYFVPIGAKPGDIAGNLGQEYDSKGVLITNQFFEPLTVKQVVLRGTDITESVLALYRLEEML